MIISAPQVHAIRSIIREAVSNIIRHANATHLSVDIETRQDHIRLSIRDNGTGLTEPLNNKGYGLESMRQRIKAIEGSLDIRSDASGLLLLICISLLSK